MINLYLVQSDGSALGFGTSRELNKFQQKTTVRDSKIYGILPHNPESYTKVKWQPPLYDSRAMMRTGEWIETAPARFIPEPTSGNIY